MWKERRRTIDKVMSPQQQQWQENRCSSSLRRTNERLGHKRRRRHMTNNDILYNLHRCFFLSFSSLSLGMDETKVLHRKKGGNNNKKERSSSVKDHERSCLKLCMSLSHALPSKNSYASFFLSFLPSSYSSSPIQQIDQCAYTTTTKKRKKEEKSRRRKEEEA